MFLEKEIVQIGNDLIKKARLEDTTNFTVIATPEMEDANLFDAKKRIVYSIPERNFYEFKSIQHLFREKFGAGASTFLKVQKIIISHEVGHALQTDLMEKGKRLKKMKSYNTLAKISSVDELLEHIKEYQELLLRTETEAWELGWDLIKENTERELFDVIKNHALESYQYADYLQEEDEFHDTYQFLLDGNRLDLIDFKTTEEGEVAQVKIKWDGEIIYAELLRKEDGYVWLKDEAKIYEKEGWVHFPAWEDSSIALFAIEELKNGLREITELPSVNIQV